MYRQFRYIGFAGLSVNENNMGIFRYINMNYGYVISIQARLRLKVELVNDGKFTNLK